MQVIVMTSDNQYQHLPAYCHLFDKYYGMSKVNTVFCGFSPLPELLYPEYRFYSIGNFDNYPPNRWSDALIKVLDDVADEVFMLMLGDYWLVRPTDTYAVQMMYDYMHQFKYVAKFDLTTDRLYSDPGFYLYGYNTYDTLGYLDLIKSKPSTSYHLSLWGGLWRRNLLRDVLIHGETAQQIELNGTHRLSQKGDDVLVLGTRQAPMRHANVIQGGEWNKDVMVGLPAMTEGDRQELRKLGYLDKG